MPHGSFLDKTQPPTEDDLALALGPAWPTWQALVQAVRERYSPKEDWRYYGTNYGWALRFRKSGKALLSLYPAEGHLTAQIILREDAVQDALAGDLAPATRQALAGAHPYPEGRWLFLKLAPGDSLDDALRLLSLRTRKTPTPA